MRVSESRYSQVKPKQQISITRRVKMTLLKIITSTNDMHSKNALRIAGDSQPSEKVQCID